MSSVGQAGERSDRAIGHNKFVLEELGRLARHFLGLIFITNCTESFQNFLNKFRSIVVPKQLVSNEIFDAFVTFSKGCLKRSWNDYTNTHLKSIQSMLSQKNPRLTGGALDDIDTYYLNMPRLGPKRIGGPSDANFSSIFSMKSL